MPEPGALDGLFAPRNVVLVGASDRAGNWGGRVLGNLKRLGFSGRVYLVNPTRRELWGERCYATLADLPEAPDHLCVLVPAETTLEVLETGAALGARAATLYAAGFGEGGDAEGVARAARLAALLERTGIAAAGPNCMGLAAGRSRLVTLPDEGLHAPRPGPVAVITQSGALCTTFSRALNDRGLACGYLVSCGNQIGLTIADYIDYMAGDPDLRAIICYIEALKDGPRFLAAARRAREHGKEIVAVKIGGAPAAREAALAHTGSLVGNVEAFDAYAREIGIIRLDGLEQTIEAAEYLAHARRPTRPGMAFMTISGAVTTLLTEAAAREGADLSTLSDGTKAKLAAALGHDEKLGNPLDTIRTIPTPQYMGCIEALTAAPEVGLLVVLEELPRETGVVRKEENFRALDAFVRRQRETEADAAPIALLSPLPFADTPASLALRAELSELPFLRGLSTSFPFLVALSHVPPAPLVRTDASDTVTARAAPWIERARRLSGPTTLNETESKALLAAFGIRPPAEETVISPVEAVAAAERIGYPVVVKAVASGIAHKSDAGLVALWLASPEAVREAADTISARVGAMGVALDGLLVAKHVSGGTEMVLGVTRDPEMGHVVMAGAGGVLLELIRDVVYATPQLDHARALAAIARTRAGRLIEGYRGHPPGDMPALAEAMVSFGRMAVELGCVLQSAEVNPLLVLDAGQGVVDLDGLVVLCPPPRPPP